MLTAGAALVLYLTRGTTLWFDEWTWALERRGGSLGTFLEPHNGHFSLVPVVLYKLLFATAGLDHYLPYRVMIAAAHVLCVGLVFVYAARRIGRPAALIPAAMLLTLGPAWQDFLWPFQIGWLLSLACGVGALLLLDRGDRRGSIGAALLLAIALASSGVGIPVAAGVLLEVLLTRRREAWIAVAPLALYGIWWVVYQDTTILARNVYLVPRFAADAAAGALGALSGLTQVGIGANGVIADAGATYPWGRPLAVAATALAVWRLATLRPFPARVVTLLAIPLAFWLLTGLQRAHVGSADASRYLYVGALFVLLLAVELVRGLALPRWVVAATAVVAAFAVLGNLGELRTGAGYLRAQAPIARGDLTALELARASLPPGYVAKHFPGTPFLAIPAAEYLAASKHDSPAYSASALPHAPETARIAADVELAAIHDVKVRPAGDARGTSCVRPRGAAELTLPAGGLLIKPGDGPVKVSLRRFASRFEAAPLATVTSPGVLQIDPDRAPQPWHVRLAPAARVEACSLA